LVELHQIGHFTLLSGQKGGSVSQRVSKRCHNASHPSQRLKMKKEIKAN